MLELLHDYRHSYPVEVSGGSGVGRLRREDDGAERMLSRREGFRLIVAIVSRCGVCWNRAPERLPGWDREKGVAKKGTLVLKQLDEVLVSVFGRLLKYDILIPSLPPRIINPPPSQGPFYCLKWEGVRWCTRPSPSLLPSS